jgi:hypothetical protein
MFGTKAPSVWRRDEQAVQAPRRRRSCQGPLCASSFWTCWVNYEGRHLRIKGGDAMNFSRAAMAAYTACFRFRQW